MEASLATPNGTAGSSRRKSGREIRKPDHFAEEEHVGSLLSNGSAKRKRISAANGADIENGSDGDDDDSNEDNQSDNDSEDEPDEEEMREKRRTQRKKGSVARPAAKKARTANGASTTLAIRSANIPGRQAGKRAKTQKARARPSQINKEGLFAEVFGRGQSSADAVDTWMKSIHRDNVAAIRNLINFIFECIGCEQTITSPDIEDIDNVPNKLGDILEEYAQAKTSEYPLISKAREYTEFRTVLVDFFTTLMQSLHSQGVLYDQPEIYDNIHVWIATMSGANYRPFRHTATVISLSLTTALCEVANEIQQSIATTKTQVETEKKKKGSNKSRLSTMNDSMKDEEKKLETVDNILRDAFDTVYVHRYRDVDERIRVECVGALGQWLLSYRKMFLEGQYLRYLGWIMSDPHSPTRFEVVRVLKSLFKGTKNIPALRAFTDRFRSRMVEMGARDADLNVRAESIELLDRLRNAELLEPDDIDTIGRLIFDSEPRVRKAVAKFFVSNVEDLYAGCIEDWDKAEYKAVLPSEVADDEYQTPVQAWIKFKCLAQTLESYEAGSQSEHGENSRGTLRNDDWDSSYMLATQSTYPYLKELHGWESLAGYILYDHSSIPAEIDESDMNQAVQAAFKLAAGEEIVLLDVLFYSVKMYLDSVLDQAKDKKGRTNALKKAIKEKQETAAHNLSLIIPQLLSRYGSTPQAARSILRLEQLLDISLIDDVQGGEGANSTILEDVKEQFLSHSDPKVLAEASNALRAARAYEPSREAVDALINGVWSESSTTLQNLLKGKTIDRRGTLDRSILSEVVNHCSRLANLASISDCSPFLEAKFTLKKQKGKTLSQETLLELVLALVQRGVPDEETTEAFVEKEDQLASSVLTIISFYFRWKIVALRKAIVKDDTEVLSSDMVAQLATQQTNFIDSVSPVITTGEPLSPLRVSAISTVLDIYTLFATTKHTQSQKDDLDEDIAAHIQNLTTIIPSTLMTAILFTHEKSSRSFARKTKRKLTFPISDKAKPNPQSRGRDAEETQEEIERPPEDSDDDDDNVNDSDTDTSSKDGQEVVGESRTAKKQAVLLAERALCEITSKIVLALLGGVVEDKEGVKERLEMNRTRLGKSYAQVVGYLDKGMGGKTRGKGKGNKEVAKTPVKKVALQQMELPDDEIHDDDDDEEENVVGEGEDEEIEEVEEEEVDGSRNGVNEEVEDEIMGD